MCVCVCVVQNVSVESGSQSPNSVHESTVSGRTTELWAQPLLLHQRRRSGQGENGAKLRGGKKKKCSFHYLTLQSLLLFLPLADQGTRYQAPDPANDLELKDRHTLTSFCRCRGTGKCAILASHALGCQHHWRSVAHTAYPSGGMGQVQMAAGGQPQLLGL